MTAVKIEKLLFVHHLIPHESLTYSTKQKLTGMELIFFTYSSTFPQLDQVHCWLFFQVLEKKAKLLRFKIILTPGCISFFIEHDLSNSVPNTPSTHKLIICYEPSQKNIGKYPIYGHQCVM